MHLEVNLRSRRIADNSYKEIRYLFLLLIFCTSFFPFSYV